MTNRLQYPSIWAQDGTAVDPDLDKTHPSYVANRYKNLGWKSEKPPEDWENFLYQITDQKIVELLTSGVLLWDASVQYPVGALCVVGGKVYSRVSIVAPAKSPELSGSGWGTVIGSTAQQYNDAITALVAKLEGHMSVANPHNDTIKNVVGGGYLKAEVDVQFNSPSNPTTIVYHKARMGQAVHGETVAQLGTLSAAAGGTFTGPVIFEKDAVVQVSPDKLVHLNQATALFELANSTVAIGIAANGLAYLTNTSGSTQLMTEASYNLFNINYGHQFALPLPVLRMNFNKSLSDADSVGIWEVSSSAEPDFSGKGLLLTGNTITLKVVDLPLLLSGVCIGYLADKTRVVAKGDFKNWVATNDTLNRIIAKGFGRTDIVEFESLTMYPRLNDSQKSMLEA